MFSFLLLAMTRSVSVLYGLSRFLTVSRTVLLALLGRLLVTLDETPLKGPMLMMMLADHGAKKKCMY